MIVLFTDFGTADLYVGQVKAVLAAPRRRIARARVFSDVAPGELSWYENSPGLAEIAANGASAQRLPGSVPGDAVAGAELRDGSG